jgi:hypothetical protein
MVDMYERFTDRARAVMKSARDETHRMSHDFVCTRHILQPDQIRKSVFELLGYDDPGAGGTDSASTVS